MKNIQVIFTTISKNERLKFYLKSIAWIIALVILVLALFGRDIFGDNALLNDIYISDDSGFSLIGSWIDNQSPVIFQTIVYAIVVFVASKLLRLVISLFLSVSASGETAAKLITSFIDYIAAIIVIFLILLAFGIDSMTLFASVGILGLVVGLSAQSLISDMISGLFIVFEKSYKVGDFIIIDSFRGQVRSIGLRTTQLMDVSGHMKIVNNSEIKTVVNLSASKSLAVVEVSVHYDDFLRADKIFKEHMDELKTDLPKFYEGPTYIGPVEFANSGINIKFTGKVNEDYRFQAERDLRTVLKAFMDKYEIEIPYPRLVVVDKESMNR